MDPVSNVTSAQRSPLNLRLTDVVDIRSQESRLRYDVLRELLLQVCILRESEIEVCKEVTHSAYK